MRFYLMTIMAFAIFAIQAQTLTGNVVDSKNNAIQEQPFIGYFHRMELPLLRMDFFVLITKDHKFLVTSYTGYEADTTEIAKPNETYIYIKLKEGVMLQTVNIQSE